MHFYPNKDNYKNVFSYSTHCSLHTEIQKYSILRQNELQVTGTPLSPVTMLPPKVLCAKGNNLYIPSPLNLLIHYDTYTLLLTDPQITVPTHTTKSEWVKFFSAFFSTQFF